MCGRFTLVTEPQELAALFELERTPALRPSYNIAPTAIIPIVRATGEGQEGAGREMVPVQWGLVPFWAKDPAIGARMINARCETVAEKPAYRAAFRYRRCLVPVDGFYEWRREGSQRQPFYFQRKDGRPFAFAGLWECWEGSDGSALETCVIITTGANRIMAAVHDRMPVIIQSGDYAQWLDPARQRPGDLAALTPLFSLADDLPLTAWPVSRHVNSPVNNDPECVKPLGDQSFAPDLSQDTLF